MAIPTNELQQLTSALGTDSVLLDTGSAGTARLSLANLAKFLTEQDNAVKTALSNKAALSAQQTVEKAGWPPVRTVELAGSELHAYIASLPRLLTEFVAVKISGSVTSGSNLNLNGFYGMGTLNLTMTDPDAVCTSHVNITNNNALIALNGFHFQDPNPGGQTARTGVYAAYGSQVVLTDCSFSSNGGANNAYAALDTYEFASVLLSDVSASGCGHVANAGPGCVVTVEKGSKPASMQNNITGAMVWHGGTVILCPGVPETLGGASNIKGGGMIVGPNGTLL